MGHILKIISPCLWIILAVFFGVIETITLGLTTCWFVFGALFAFLAACLGASWGLQVIIFLFTTIILLIFFRPLAKSFFKIGAIQTGAPGLIEQMGIVQEDINPPHNGVVVVQGQVWTAESLIGEMIEKGEKVVIKGINGAALKVQKLKK